MKIICMRILLERGAESLCLQHTSIFKKKKKSVSSVIFFLIFKKLYSILNLHVHLT